MNILESLASGYTIALTRMFGLDAHPVPTSLSIHQSIRDEAEDNRQNTGNAFSDYMKLDNERKR